MGGLPLLRHMGGACRRGDALPVLSISLLMIGQELGDFGVEFLLLVRQLVKGPAPRLGGIGGQFEPVQRKDCAAESLLVLTDQEHITEHRQDLILHRRHKGRDGAVIRALQTGYGQTDHMGPAELFDPPRADHPPGIRQEDHLQEDLRIVGRTARVIILVAGIKEAQLQMAIDQDVDRVFEGARKSCCSQDTGIKWGWA